MNASKPSTQLQARRSKLLDALKIVLKATSCSVVLNGHEFKIIDRWRSPSNSASTGSRCSTT